MTLYGYSRSYYLFVHTLAVLLKPFYMNRYVCHHVTHKNLIFRCARKRGCLEVCHTSFGHHSICNVIEGFITDLIFGHQWLHQLHCLCFITVLAPTS